MATESEIVVLAREFDAAVQQRDDTQARLTQHGDKQAELARLLAQMNQRVNAARTALRQALQGN